MHNRDHFTFHQREYVLAKATVATNTALSQPANDTCNVCTACFWPMWIPFFPGNFFGAQVFVREKALVPKL
jgi:hypothetical protein